MATKKRARKERRTETIPFNNLIALLIIIFTINSVIASWVTYDNSRKVVQELTGEAITQEAQARLCVNKPLTIIQNCSPNATESTGYYCDVDVSDPDNDTITFSDNTTLFDIDSTTGEIIFTPNASDIGNYSILITADDGKGCANSYDTTSFNLTINESGAGPGPGPGPPPGGGGGGGGTGLPPKECSPQWECTPWSLCGPDARRTRTCYTLNNCPVDKPAEEEGCIYLLPPAPRAPREKTYEFCDFNTENECLRNVGPLEDWIITYDQHELILNIIGLYDSGIDATLDDAPFSAGLKRIKEIDLDGDGAPDIELIVHSVEDGRTDITGRRIKQIEVVVERPVYIQRVPDSIAAPLMFVYSNACFILLLVMIMIAAISYFAVIRRAEEEKEQEQKELSKKKRN